MKDLDEAGVAELSQTSRIPEELAKVIAKLSR
jgi:hypothetical protein